VQARWDAVIKADFKKAYTFETPEFRKANKPEDYAFQVGRSQIRWHVASLKELRYDRPDEVEAVIILEYSFALPGGDQLVQTEGKISDRWVYVDDQWWRETAPTFLGGKTQSKPSLHE
jgi:hypothetical protein